MRNYFKILLYLIVLIGYSVVNSGSYEDFFTAIKRDDDKGLTALLNRAFDANTLNPEGEHGLHLALRESSLKAFAVLLRWEKIDVNVRNAKDENPLMLAAIKGQTAIAKQLIDKDADVNKPGWTPLHYAATHGHLELMSLLLEHHAYIDASSPNDSTPLMLAAMYGTPAAVKLLLEAGADPLLRNQQGLTAIDFARKASRADIVELIAAFIRASQPPGKW